MKVTLDAMGKTIGATADGIVADASRKMAALAAYAGSLSQQTKAQTAPGGAGNRRPGSPDRGEARRPSPGRRRC